MIFSRQLYTLFVVIFISASCNSLHNGIPKADKQKIVLQEKASNEKIRRKNETQIVVAKNAKDLNENFTEKRSIAQIEKDQLYKDSIQSDKRLKNEELIINSPKKDTSNVSKIRPHSTNNTVALAEKIDPEERESDDRKSKEISVTGLILSLLPYLSVAGVFAFIQGVEPLFSITIAILLFLTGVIGTILTARSMRRLKYVSSESRRRMRGAKKNLIVFGILSLVAALILIPIFLLDLPFF